MSPLQVKGEEWMRDAICLEYPPDWWFGERGEHGTVARKICKECLVRRECLTYALEAEEHYGIWGGCGYHELARYRRRRACPDCGEDITPEDKAWLIIRATDIRFWTCRRCHYRRIAARRRT